jgi:1,2-diacylglycerol 3-beta-glucosyltransferase
MNVLSGLIAIILSVFIVRRLIFLIVALWPSRRPLSENREPPTVHVLVPCRDEAAVLPGLLAALDALDYPRDRLSVTVLDDGSRDATRAIAQQWAQARAWAAVRSWPESRGKSAALAEACAPCGDPATAPAAAEVVWVYDADHRPAADSLRRAMRYFADERVGAVNGLMLPDNGLDSLPAYYATVEALVHQRVTMQAKDRLDLAPAVLGSNCGYRRAALEAAGGFAPGLLLEDSDLTIVLVRAGWRVRFAPEAVSAHQAPVTLAGYWRQHVRWARGFYQVAGRQLGALLRDNRLSPWLRLELALFALGYLDRLALLAATALLAVDAFAPAFGLRASGGAGLLLWVWLLYFAVPWAQVVAAFALQRAPRGYWLRLGVVPLFFVLDVIMAVASALASALRRPLRWARTERVVEGA